MAKISPLATRGLLFPRGCYQAWGLGHHRNDSRLAFLSFLHGTTPEVTRSLRFWDCEPGGLFTPNTVLFQTQTKIAQRTRRMRWLLKETGGKPSSLNEHCQTHGPCPHQFIYIYLGLLSCWACGVQSRASVNNVPRPRYRVSRHLGCVAPCSLQHSCTSFLSSPSHRPSWLVAGGYIFA